MGYEVVEHDKPVQLEGYHGDKREQKAEIVLPRRSVGSASNDIGFAKQSDGSYKAIISDFDRSKHNDKWLGTLTKNYATKKVMKEAKNSGFAFISKKNDNKGNTVIKFSVGR